MWKRQVSIKKQYGTPRHFLRGDEDCHYLGQRYMKNSTILARREWRGVKDTSVAFGSWAVTWGKMALFAAKNPVRIIRAFWKYRWLSAYLTAPAMVDRWVEGDRGLTLKADLCALDCMISDSIDILWELIRADRNLGETKYSSRVFAIDYTLPRHLFFGFPDYYSVNIQQQAAAMLPLLRKNLGAYYIDQSVSSGIPGDMCTLPLVEIGVAVENEYPDVGDFWISTNIPCDANVMGDSAMYRALSKNGEKDVYVFTSPLQYDDPSTNELAVHELYDLIDFMEKKTGRKFNWDTFRQHLADTNRINRQDLERWEIVANSNYGVLNAVAMALYRIYFYEHGGTKHFIRTSDKILKLYMKSARKKMNNFPKLRHRACAWSAGAMCYVQATSWLYNCWGILCIINMDSCTGHNMIELDDREEMMEDVADCYCRTPMRTHTIGGNRHLMQMWETAEKFNCDTILLYDGVGCKGMASAQGLLEEEINRHRDQFHVIWMPHSLMDTRVVPAAEGRRAVNQYMMNVLHEEPLDPTLLDFDDSEGW